MLGVETPSLEQKIVNLSGGNQQKVVVGKWLPPGPRCSFSTSRRAASTWAPRRKSMPLLARRSIEQGVGVIVVSSDLPEILAVSDHIVVIKKGRVGGRTAQGRGDSRSASWRPRRTDDPEAPRPTGER